jgi:hypothetical protein
MNPALTTLLLAGRQAPSADNMQPWAFAVDEPGRRITLLRDASRKASPALIDEQLMDQLSLGAVVENLLRTAHTNGWTATLDRATPPAVAVVRLADGDTGPGQVDPLVAARATNRRLYDGRALAPDVLARLAGQAPPPDGVTTHWIIDRGRLPGLGALLGRADTARLSEPSLRRSLLSKLRFDRPDDAGVEQGLSLPSLELSRSQRLALRLVPHLPGWLLSLSGAPRQFGDTGRRQVESASGLCLVAAPDYREETALLVGRAMQRAWLALTAEGMAVQPMMSAVGLACLLSSAPDVFQAVGREAVAALCRELTALLPEVGAGQLACLMRFGFAPAPSGPCGRLPLEALLARPS